MYSAEDWNFKQKNISKYTDAYQLFPEASVWV